VALTVEFTVEPFVDGAPGPHVTAALEAARATGLEVDFGPFGTSVRGDDADVLAAMAPISEAAIAAGASRISFQVAPA
jgi:uncharacterized protein YqgV (UPF0045/DUF77 family)